MLVVGMADSIHLARWLKLFSDEPMEIVLLPSSPSRRIHPWLKELAEQKFQIPLQLHLPKVTKYLGAASLVSRQTSRQPFKRKGYF